MVLTSMLRRRMGVLSRGLVDRKRYAVANLRRAGRPGQSSAARIQNEYDSRRVFVEFIFIVRER